ncbi:hypothetical protein HPB47_022180, partial [Ixodes persulcatus]
NIMVISTPDDIRARKYANVKAIKIGDGPSEVSAYAAAPHGTVKCVVKSMPLEDSAATINENVVNAAQRIGTSTTIIVAFEGPKAPNYVYYGGRLLRYTLYRKHYVVCRTCGKVGHRSDNCHRCGAPASQGHHCTPKCKLCGGSHFTGDRECKNKFKTPYVVRRMQWERKAEVLAGKQEKAGRGIPSPTAENIPPLRMSVRASTRASSRSRSRSRSTGGKVTWAQVAEPENKKVKALKEANRQQAKTIAEQDAVIRRIATDMAAMRKMIQQLKARYRNQAEEIAETAEEPPIKRKNTEGAEPIESKARQIGRKDQQNR